MPWTERQQALLAAMGLKLCVPSPSPSPSTSPSPPAALTATLAQTHAAAPEAAAGIATPATDPAAKRLRQQPQQPSPQTGPPQQTQQQAATQAATQPATQPATHAARNTVNPQPARPLTERQAHIATLDWPTLRDTVAGCQACSLHQSRTQTVFGVGHPQAHWMVVGEAPGEQEDLAGEPFVGPSGQLLDRMLAALRLTRADDDSDVPPARRVYIANTLKCRPPRNRNPAPQEMAECEPYLQRQIALVQPRIILAMGGFAIKMLLRTEQPVGKLRGQVHRYQGVPLVVTYHPAYLLRSLQEKAKAWDDLCLAASVVEGAADSSGHGAGASAGDGSAAQRA